MSAFVEYSHCQASQSCRKTLYGAGETCESRTADVAPVAPYGQHFSGYGVVGACLPILATIFMHPLLRLLKTPAEILEESYSYISILSIFLFVMFAYNLCSGLLRAIGNSFMPLVFLIFSSLVNIVLDLDRKSVV